MTKRLPGIRTKTGSAKGLKPGHNIQGAALAQTDPFRWTKEVYLPALARHGIDITDKNAVSAQVTRDFTNTNTAQLINIFATQTAKIERDMKQVAKAQGLGSADFIQTHDPNVALTGLKALDSAAGSMGVRLATAMAGPMSDLSKAIGGYTGQLMGFMDKHPKIRELIDKNPVAAATTGAGAALGATFVTIDGWRARVRIVRRNRCDWPGWRRGHELAHAATSRAA